MKRVLVILLTAALLVSFAACKGKEEPTTGTTTTESTTKAVSETTTAATTTAKKKESTTKQKTDISFIYKGFWYKNEGNKVVAMRFEKSGSLTLNTFRRKTIGNADNTPDSIIYGNFKDNGDGTLSVIYDNESPDEVVTYSVGEGEKLICVNEDPEGESTQELQNFSTLSKDTARRVLLGES